MANIWLRLYHEMPNDPKWRTIARVSGQTIPVVLAVYVHLLTIASAAPERGTLVNANREDLASVLDVDPEAVGAVLDAMQGRVLDGDKLSGWDKRQVNREDSSTERVKRYRERKLTQVKHNVTADEKREEEIKKKQVPSRGKREADPRHVPFKAAVDAYAAYKRVELPWDGSEAKALDLLLKSLPAMTLQEFQACLNHRARSQGLPHGERPRV